MLYKLLGASPYPQLFQQLISVLVYTTVRPTVDVTKTSTVTYVSPKQTSYAACATNNIVSSANGGAGINEIVTTEPNEDDNTLNYETVDADDAYDCCVACQTNAGGCGGYIYFSGVCQISTYTTTCNPDNSGQIFYTGGSFFTIGNGPCGQIANGG